MKKEYGKLPKAFKNKWTKALRSGEYKQGKGFLVKSVEGENRYCCLGVAGEVCGVTKMAGQGFFIRGMGIKGITKIPSILIGRAIENPLTDHLSTLNDREKWSFKRIATWVEKNL